MKTLAVALALTLAACGIPRDPEGTLERVDGGVMRVGVTDAPPWVELGAEEPDGIEVRLIESLAEELDAEIEWVEGGTGALWRSHRTRSRSRGRRPYRGNTVVC